MDWQSRTLISWLRAHLPFTGKRVRSPMKSSHGGAHALEKLLKAARFKPPHDQQNAVGAAGVKVGAESILKRAEKTRAAVFGLCIQTQPRQLAGDNALQTESGGGNPFKTIHLFPPETIDRVFNRYSIAGGGRERQGETSDVQTKTDENPRENGA